MKEITSKIASFLLAIVVLLSTFSFSVDKHYCNGHLSSPNVSGIETCDMNMHKCKMSQEKKCEKENISCRKIQKENCCKHVIKIISNDNQEQLTVQKISLKKIHILLAFINSYASIFKNYITNFIPVKNYISPTVFHDFGVLFQTFRI